MHSTTIAITLRSSHFRMHHLLPFHAKLCTYLVTMRRLADFPVKVTKGVTRNACNVHSNTFTVD